MTYAAATSRSHRASHHSNVSSPTNSKATHKTHRELYLETEVTNLRNEFAQFKATQAGGTVSSKSSNKSNREIELETQVMHLTQMVHQQNQTINQQSVMISDLKNSMQAFITHFQHSANLPTTSFPQDGKRKDSPAQTPHISKRPSHGTNNAGKDTEMAAPPDPLLEPQAANQSFESANMSVIETQYYDDESVQGSLALDAQSMSQQGVPHATRSKSDMKKQC